MIGLPKGRVGLAEYTDEYERAYKREEGLLEGILGDFGVSMTHIGSTSIPGLVSRPILDILVTVPNISEVQKFLRKLIIVGYKIVINKHFKDILYLEKGTDQNTTCCVYIAKSDSATAQNLLAFKRFMFNHGAFVEEFNKLKKKLANKYANNEQKYNSGKEAYIKKIIKMAKKEVVFEKKIKF